MRFNYFTVLFLVLNFNSFSQSDCSEAIIICGNIGFSGLNANGAGNIQEITRANSCGFGEYNSVWLKLIIKTSGTLGFVLTPESDDIGIDFDFFVFGPNLNCNALGNTIRCSTTNPIASGATNNLTGMNDQETDVSEGPAQLGNNYVKWMTVTAGESYFLAIDRPIGDSNFSIQWTGSATFNDPPIISTPPNTSIDLFSCDDNDAVVDGFTTFDLSLNTGIIKGLQTNVTVSYHESQNDATLGID